MALMVQFKSPGLYSPIDVACKSLPSARTPRLRVGSSRLNFRTIPFHEIAFATDALAYSLSTDVLLFETCLEVLVYDFLLCRFVRRSELSSL